MAHKRLHLRVSGRVQGVGFRFHTERSAPPGVTGWVRNRADGSVEVLAEGDEGLLEQLLEAVRRGPRTSRVDSVLVDWQDPRHDLESFGIR